MAGRSISCLTALLAVAPWSAPAAAATKVAAFSCHIGDGRTKLLAPPAKEKESDDELSCRVSVTGLRGRSARDLAVELRILPPAGTYRVVATGRLEPADDGRDGARIDELIVPHATWVSAVDWRPRPTARVRLVLRVLDKPAPGARRWRLLAVRRLELKGPGRGR